MNSIQTSPLSEIMLEKDGKIRTKSSRAGDYVVVAICVFLILIYLAPFVNIISRSLSSPNALVNNRVSFWPVDFTLDSYVYVFSDAAFSRSLVFTAILTVVCTFVSMTMTILAAYPLTYDLKGGRFLNLMIIFTMYFSAGTIPNYLLMKQLHLLENPLVLVLPNCLSVFNMIILRSFFWGIPDSLRESAELDGAGPVRILLNIYLPLSVPVLATLALFYAVGRWNGFSDALMYITDIRYQPIQLKLWQIINNRSSIEIASQEGFTTPAASEGLKAASVMFATVPILLVYPWLQRYFITGVTIGALKG
ncbi:MAG TPA: carbohydrate ABC transporter permease [Clostridiales bacterium]|nr:carbohydrate ABC transporter permease [Clostridiales bacterium]HPZ05910.1 carbohydrate ABC transporter permease [Clostridiales bacterium]HQD31824.1 carbohydrate ABC transporter permease [Clostridiales bacterium]